MAANGKLEFKETGVYRRWYKGLRDKTTKYRITSRLRQIIEEGHFGKAGSVGEGVYEIQFDFGPGYRIYYCQAESTVYWLLVGGDKDSQPEDIRQAKQLKRTLEGRHGRWL